jgi:dihydrofolate reductase
MRLTVTTFLSLDGVYQSPGAPDEDGTGYAYGGWTAPYGDEDFGKFMSAGFANAEAFLLGRKTYEIFAGYWPRVTDPDNPIAAPLNSLPKYVVTSTLASLDWHNSTPVTGDLADEVGKLKARPGNELQVQRAPGNHREAARGNGGNGDCLAVSSGITFPQTTVANLCGSRARCRDMGRPLGPYAPLPARSRSTAGVPGGMA